MARMTFSSSLMEVNFKWQWVAVGVAGFGLLLIRRYMAGGVCRSRRVMTGKTVIITGANTGIGKATATELAKRDARVILACRDTKKAEQAAQDIRRVTGSRGQLVVMKLDLASFASIHEFADNIKREEIHVDVLINNAGVYQCPERWLTEDKLEMQMGVNHFGHFLLTNLLLDKLKASVPSRVVIVSSGLHRFGKIEFDNLQSERAYDKAAVYNNSKLANNLFARVLASRLDGTGVAVHCLRPGMVRSDLGRHVPMSRVLTVLAYPLAWLLVKSTYEGCQTVVHCAVSEELDNVSGRFYGDCKEEEWSEQSLDDGVAAKLWEISAKTVHL